MTALSPAIALRRTRSTFSFALVSVAGVLPLALVFAPGPVQVVGWIYGAVWLWFIIPSTTGIGFTLVECVRILSGRGPFILSTVVAEMHIRHEAEAKLVARHFPREWFYVVAVRLNPLTNFARAALSFTLTVRPEVMEIIARDAQAAFEELRKMRMRQPTIDLTTKVIDNLDQPQLEEMQLC